MEARLVEVALDVLGVEARECEACPHVGEGGAVFASIGFAGEDMHGALAVLGLEPAVRAVVAAVFGTPADSDALLCDMVGELSNLLLGRYRAVLLREGIEILPATPLTLRAAEVDIRGIASRKASWRLLQTPQGQLWLCLDVSFREGFELASASAEPVTPNEQPLMFFE